MELISNYKKHYSNKKLHSDKFKVSKKKYNTIKQIKNKKWKIHTTKIHGGNINNTGLSDDQLKYAGSTLIDLFNMLDNEDNCSNIYKMRNKQNDFSEIISKSKYKKISAHIESFCKLSPKSYSHIFVKCKNGARHGCLTKKSLEDIIKRVGDDRFYDVLMSKGKEAQQELMTKEKETSSDLLEYDSIIKRLDKKGRQKKGSETSQIEDKRNDPLEGPRSLGVTKLDRAALNLGYDDFGEMKPCTIS